MITVCWKWVRHGGDERWAGTSDADRAALELGLRLAATTADTVTVVSVGDAGAERGLREALAAGARRAVRIDGPAGLTSAAVAAAIAATVDVSVDNCWVLCGDASADRGSGSVPAFLAAALGTAQALGLVTVGLEAPPGEDRPLPVVRRLDGGRREVLAVTAPAVLSVEGSVARLRRATLPAELAAAQATIDVVAGPAGPVERPTAVHAYRPRARALAAPAGSTLSRIRVLTGVVGGDGDIAATTETVVADPPDAARRILDALTAWGYLGS